MTRERTKHSRGRRREHRPHTVSVSLRDRGQTTQDFAVGIGVFILAVAFVFSFLPTILTPFDSTVSGGETAQADRIADRLVHNLSAEDSPSPNEIDGERFRKDFASDDDNLTESLGLRASDSPDIRYDRINVTIEHLNGTSVTDEAEWSAGDRYDGQSAASSARIVAVDHEEFPKNDQPAYRLVVRVW
ncbi:hypothetical protein GS429_18385 [Natronorubrum sp. JWXQ-INN-674]|uniref:Uncharacterized protein n=1 Tax=Natronorubrum halalkaliphilum TaxID=2691917 RepID=A0A6B0VRD5_9EURY|nr:hypothetical protein [Natronorubrum halalkaliphilum]MXV63994.1 hypothetical protein [Natronorubrum halalkaliphilum]